jgi:hypothetical protein
MSMASTRTAIKEAIESATLRAYDFLPAAPQLPCAVVGWPSTLNPHAAFGDNPSMELPVYVMVAFNNNRSADDNLEQYIATTGDASVIAAVEAISAAYRVAEVRDFGVIAVGEQPINSTAPTPRALSCTLVVQVME